MVVRCGKVVDCFATRYFAHYMYFYSFYSNLQSGGMYLHNGYYMTFYQHINLYQNPHITNKKECIAKHAYRYVISNKSICIYTCGAPVFLEV